MFVSKRQHPSLLRLSVPIVVMVLTALSMTSVSAEDDYCMRMDGTCRMKSQWNDTDVYRSVKLNISCVCENDEPEEVWKYLDSLSRKKCTYLPTDDGMKVNHSIIHLSGCFVREKVFPTAILDLARRTDHLEIVMNQCPYVRLDQIKHEQRKVPRFTVSLSDSKLSGLPRGWLGNAEQMQVRIKRCEIPIVEPRAISGFSDDDDVLVDIVNTNISNVQMLAFELPPLGRLNIEGGTVTTWQKLGYQGGSKVNLKGVRFDRLLGGAFNLYGVTSFNMTECIVAELTAGVVTDQNKGTEESSLDMSSRIAEIKHNKFVRANGEAFINLCKFPSVSWQNNTFGDLADSPPRLQDVRCETKRNWRDSIVVTGLSCMNCEDFASVDEQSCAFYRTGYCTSCKEEGDACDAPVVPYIIQTKCPISHPQIVTALTDVCKLNPNAPQPSARSFNGAYTTSSASVIMITLTFLFTYIFI